LKQGSRTVEAYAADFTKLLKYCPYLVQQEIDKVRRFAKGLRPELKRTLTGITPETFGDAVEVASRVESDDLEATE
jgi:hypothetical protein